jgi:hypothetical protein
MRANLNADAAVQALAAGAQSVVAVAEAYGWRLGRVVDPFGHHWEIGRSDRGLSMSAPPSHRIGAMPRRIFSGATMFGLMSPAAFA